MAEKKLFNLVQESTPSSTDLMVAYGSSSVGAKNMKLSDLKSWISGAFNTSIYDIGTWNMDGQSEWWVITDIPYADILKIRKVTVMIRSDDFAIGQKILTDITGQDGTFTIGPDSETFSGKVAVLITRPTSGYYDNTTYNDTTINRGWVTVEYTN